MSRARRAFIAPLFVACIAAPHGVAVADTFASPARASSAAGPHGSVPLAFEPVSGSDEAPHTFVARADRYAVAIDAHGLAIDAGGEAAVRMRLVGARPTRPVGEDRIAVAHRLVGSADTWRADLPLYARVRLDEVWNGIDLVYYGAGRQVEWDFIVAPGDDPGTIAFRLDGGEVRLDERGHLAIRTAAGTLLQRQPVAYQVGANGDRDPVPAGYVRRQDGTIGFALGAYDPRRPLVIDPVLVFDTYLGGPGGEFWVGSNVAGIALDRSGNVVVVGDTSNPSFSGATTIDLRAAGGGRDVFVARLSPDGAKLLSLTTLGGNGLDDRASVAVGADGSIFVSGRTVSTNLAVTTGGRAYAGGQEAFVYKLNPTASAVLFCTYIGGANDESANALTLDVTGRPVVVGATSSPTFPATAGAPQTGSGGGTDAFVASLNATTGAIEFASFLGGSGADEAFGVRVNDLGQIFVTGSTQSADFPKVNPVQATLAGTSDAFVAAMTPGSATLLASTYFGGAGGANSEVGHDIAIGPSRSVFIVGSTDSPSLPITAGSAQPAPGGQLDGFAARFDWNGAVLTKAWATYLGGTGNDAAFAVAVGNGGNATITGATQSPNFPPSTGAFDTTLGGTQDAFVLTLNANGTSIADASYFGGAGIDTALAITLDAAGDAYVAGQTTSTDLPTAGLGGANPYNASSNGEEDAFILRVAIDQDHDGLPDWWETQNGLDPGSNSGENGATGDPDRDQLTNLEEFDLGTDPKLAQRFFAEGAIGTIVSFQTRFAVLNPWTDVTTKVTFKFMDTGGQTYMAERTLAPGQRDTVLASEVPGLSSQPTTEFSTEITSLYGIVADRTMTWDTTGYGSTAETSISTPSPTWYLAEGATHSNFSLYYLLQNPGSTASTVRITYLRPAPKTPLQKTYTVGANARRTIEVNSQRFPDDNTGDLLLASEEVSAVVEVLSGPAIIVERSMYQTNPGQPFFAAGHESAGVVSPSLRWFLAEGATNPDFFSEFILIANPSQTAAEATVTYLLESGQPIVKRYGGANADYPALGPQSRTTIWVNLEDQRLANAAVSAIIQSTNGVGLIVERAMWWPGDGSRWTEAHNSPGTTTTGTVWALAEGEQGGALANDTYILIANTSAFPGRARVTLHYEDGTSEAAIVTLAASSRRTVSAGSQPEFTRAAGKRFAAIVEALPATDGGADVPQIVVERAMYSADSTGAFRALFPPNRPYWPAGTNAVGTKLQ